MMPAAPRMPNRISSSFPPLTAMHTIAAQQRAFREMEHYRDEPAVSAWLDGQLPAGSGHARLAPSAAVRRVIVSRLVWSLTCSGSQAQAM